MSLIRFVDSHLLNYSTGHFLLTLFFFAILNVAGTIFNKRVIVKNFASKLFGKRDLIVSRIKKKQAINSEGKRAA